MGALPPGVGEGTLEVLREALHLPAQVHVLEQSVGQLAQLSLLLGAERVPHGLGGGHPLGKLLEQLVEVLGVAREHVAEALHELPEGRVQLLAPLALFEHAIEGVIGVPHPRHLFGAHGRQRLGGTFEERLGHLAAKVVEQLVEPPARPRRRSRSAGELRSGQPGRQVEGPGPSVARWPRRQ